MRAGPPLCSALIVLSTGSLLGLGCLLNSGAFESTGATSSATEGGGTTTPSTGGGGTTTTTAPNGGGGAGGTTTTAPNGGGGVGGTTITETTGGGGTGGTTTTSPTLAKSCKDAKDNFGSTGAKVVEIDPDGDDGPVVPFDVFCDQTKDGGGWALLYNSIGDPMGQTTAFWNIPYAKRFDIKGEPAIDKNYYAGALYRYGQEYRDDALDEGGVEVLGIMRATATGINEDTMKLTQPVKLAGNLSTQLYAYHFEGGWSSSDHDADTEVINCAALYANVTQHYTTCWKYSLGADVNGLGSMPPLDYSDGGWGPHIINKIIDEINTTGSVDPPLAKASGADGDASRMKRISRFTRW